MLSCIEISHDKYSLLFKHIAVSNQDLGLQVIEFGGKYFVETKLVFGSRSSPGIYDEASDIVLDIVLHISGQPRNLVEKHLDDVLGAGSSDPEDPVQKCFQTYLDVAKEVGIRLPPVDQDKDKLQAPSTIVTALGMEYDTDLWMVRCPELKLGIILHTIRGLLASRTTTAGELASLAGKLVDKSAILEGARFNSGSILSQVDSDAPEELEVKLTDTSCEQLRWWYSHLGATAWYCHIQHPDEAIMVPPGTVEVNSDAAGGNSNNLRGGSGVLLPDGSWAYFAWPSWLHAGKPGPDGKSLNSQLQFLELCGPLIALASSSGTLSNIPVNYRIDNQSAVYTWRKGYSRRDPLSTTVVKAIYDLSLHLNSKPFVTKVAWCSTLGSIAADHISKGNLKDFFALSQDVTKESLRIPGCLVRWLSWPTPDLGLGGRIAAELKSRGVEIRD